MFTRNSFTDGEAPHQNQSDSNLSHSASPFPSLFLSQSLLHGRYWHFTSNLLFYTNFNAESVIRCAEGVEFQLPSSSFSLRYSSSLPVLWKSSFPLQNPMALSSWPSSLSLSSPSLQSPLAVSRPVPPSPGTSHGHRGTALRCSEEWITDQTAGPVPQGRQYLLRHCSDMADNTEGEAPPHAPLRTV